MLELNKYKYLPCLKCFTIIEDLTEFGIFYSLEEYEELELINNLENDYISLIRLLDCFNNIIRKKQHLKSQLYNYIDEEQKKLLNKQYRLNIYRQRIQTLANKFDFIDLRIAKYLEFSTETNIKLLIDLKNTFIFLAEVKKLDAKTQYLIAINLSHIIDDYIYNEFDIYR